MVSALLLVFLGAVVIAGVYLQSKRLRRFSSDSDFYDLSSYSLSEKFAFHIVIAPVYALTILPYKNASFRLRHRENIEGPIPLPKPFFWAVYAIHFFILQLILIAAFATILFGTTEINKPLAILFLLAVGYSFYWKWLFAPIVLTVGIGLHILSFVFLGEYNPIDITTTIFELALSPVPARQFAALYVYLVTISLIVTVTPSVIDKIVELHGQL